MEAILSLDIGTTSMRGVLFSLTGEVISLSQKHTSPVFLPDGRVEQEPECWKQALYDIFEEIASGNTARIIGVSVTAFRSPVFPITVEGVPLAPAIMWQDRRTDTLCESLKEHEDRVFRKSGLKITSVFSGVKMMWYKQNRPDLRDRTEKLIGVQEYIIYLLTGEFVTDHSLASRTNLFNLETLSWDDELLEIFGIEREELCRLVPPGAVCGPLTSPMKELLGSEESIPVISAGGDQQCASLGLGLIHEGDLVVNTGTGSYVLAYSDKPIIDSERRIFCNVGAIPGTYIIEASTLASGTIYRWLSEELYDEIPGGESLFKRIDREILESVIGSHGVIHLPHLTGRGAPYWNSDAKGVFYGISLATKRGDLARSVLEAIAIEISENIDLIEAMNDPVDRVSIAGGMTKFDLFNQIQADTYDKQVIHHENQEATAVGAWISAAVTLGIYDSYQKAFATYCGDSSTTVYTPEEASTWLYQELKKEKQRLYTALN